MKKLKESRVDPTSTDPSGTEIPGNVSASREKRQTSSFWVPTLGPLGKVRPPLPGSLDLKWS